jgi:hypothetical protein
MTPPKIPPRTVAVIAIHRVYDQYVRERREAGDTTTDFIHARDEASVRGYGYFDSYHLDSHAIDGGHWRAWEIVRSRLIYAYCDGSRHLISYPYTRECLHRVARELGIRPCWFHASADHPHYDIPLHRREEIEGRVRKVSSRDLLKIIRGGVPADLVARTPGQS